MRAVLFVIILAAVALSGAINAALGEEWLCETTILEGKPPAKTKWVINGDQMRAFGAKDAFRVLRNDDRFVVAFFKKRNPFLTLYLILDKMSGALIELEDLGSEFEPGVEVGHCSR